MIINLISDTITKPTSEMLKAMMQADVGDDVFGDDPTVNQLQKKLAAMFGKEDALYFPSGTMANQAAINLHTNSGEQLICDKWAHVYNFEGGGAAANSGVSCFLIDGDRGMFTANQVEEVINAKENIHLASTTLVTVENTTNKGGGACWDLSEIKKIKQVCIENDLAFHLDGARLFNALVAKGETPKQYGEQFDTISICLSKGLGAPIGSVLIGTKAHIKKALRIRKRFGGAMRQVGYLAAAGIYALDNHVNRLVEDHEKAKRIGKALNTLTYISKVEPIDTNIVIFNLTQGIDGIEFINKLKEKGVLITSMGSGKLRMVTHLDFTGKMLDRLLDVLNKIVL
jgi:threonine aldolase